MSSLFQPLEIRGLTMANRVVVAPMCQYSAENGVVQDWHWQHYGALVASGPGMVVIEATAVAPEGRITPLDVGLYSDEAEAAFTSLVRRLKRLGSSAIAVQLAHAGRKASAAPPWMGSPPLTPEEGAWETVSASALAFGQDWPVPREAGAYELDAVRRAFILAAERAVRAGVDAIELHVAHGYLLHQFLSPLSNTRTDVYGGSFDNRTRFPLEVLRGVRRAIPAEMPLGLRISATDWVDGGFIVDEAVAFLAKCRGEGVDYACVSSGGLLPNAAIPTTPGYQVPLAKRVRAETGILTRAVGLITDPAQADGIVERGEADMVALGRAFLDDPRWVWHAAAKLGAYHPYPPQYSRARPTLWPGAPRTSPISVAH